MIFQNSLNTLAGINVRCLPLRYPKLLPLSIYLRSTTSFSTKPIRLPCLIVSLPVRLSDRLLTFTNPNFNCPKRYEATQRKDLESRNYSVSEKKGSTKGSKFKEAARSTFYIGGAAFGYVIVGIVLYTIIKELFSSQSPTGVYTNTANLCKDNIKVKDSLGEPIKSYGEETSRGRRRHASHVSFERDGVKYMRMKFYLEGTRRKGTVHLEVQQNAKGKFEYRYLFVELDGYPRRTIILQDNR